MNTNLMLLSLNRGFDTLEYLGILSDKEIAIMLYLMFIDEYYETIRDITLQDNTDPRGLNDNLVIHLNNKIKLIIECSNIFTKLDSLESILHWIIPDLPNGAETI